MKKITVANPIVEITGDELAQVLWDLIKEELILPYLDLPICHFDLSLNNRYATNDVVTQEAVASVLKHQIGIKCPTLVPNEDRQLEYNLPTILPDPNQTFSSNLGGAIFREPILCKNVPRRVPGWSRPIVVGWKAKPKQVRRRTFSKSGSDLSTLQLCVGDSDQPACELPIETPGRATLEYCSEASIREFIRASMHYALQRRWPLYISLDPYYCHLVTEIFEREFQDAFHFEGLVCEHIAATAMVATVMRSPGAFLWLCTDELGPLMSEWITHGFGSKGLLTSTIITADGQTILTEPGHGTLSRQFRDYQKGREIGLNPLATIFAWTRGLLHRGRLDSNQELLQFAIRLEGAAIETVENGFMTKDLAVLLHGTGASRETYATSHEYITHLQKLLR